MILSGEKKEEYREYKSYWRKRLTRPCPKCDRWCNDGSCECGGYYDEKEKKWHFGVIPKEFDIVVFSNGYHKNRRQFEIELKEMRYGLPRKYSWGGGKENCIILELGKITKRIRC